MSMQLRTMTPAGSWLGDWLVAPITRFGFLVAAILCGSSAVAQEEETDDRRIEEIVVTASKLGEVGVQDLPMSVSAISEEFLTSIGANEFEDFYRYAPGLTVKDGGPGLKTYIIRGISLPGSIPAVGQYLDEWLTPVGTAIGAVAGIQFDPKVVDVNRVEVLKGPQGTLYGASAMAGIVRIISNKPDVTQWDYMFETDLSSTYEGGDNLALKGMLNIPISRDRLALRTAAYYYDVSGFIDNVVTG